MVNVPRVNCVCIPADSYRRVAVQAGQRSCAPRWSWHDCLRISQCSANNHHTVLWRVSHFLDPLLPALFLKTLQSALLGSSGRCCGSGIIAHPSQRIDHGDPRQSSPTLFLGKGADRCRRNRNKDEPRKWRASRCGVIPPQPSHPVHGLRRATAVRGDLEMQEEGNLDQAVRPRGIRAHRGREVEELGFEAVSLLFGYSETKRGQADLYSLTGSYIERTIPTSTAGTPSLVVLRPWSDP
jgi:hypothetical protein